MLKRLIKKIIGPANIQTLKSLYKSAEEKALMRKRLEFYAQIVGKGDTYFDVGANYGNRIEVMLQLGCRVVAVEPQKECQAFLQRKYGPKIILIDKALGEKEELKEFFISNASTLSTFSEEWINNVKASGRFAEYEWNKKETVEMTTLDKLIQLHGAPQFIKIDVEGYEFEVLKGLTTPVKWVSIEYTVPEQTDKAIQCIQHLQSISKDNELECNYSEGETMEWGHRWLPAQEMVHYVQTDEFQKTGFGDIYIRLKNNPL